MTVWTEDRVKNLLNEKTFDEGVTEKGLTQDQIREVRENILYKLYKLQNYNVTMDMFLGSTVRWRTIKLYASVIRGITKGKIHEYMNTNSKYSPYVIKYIQGLIDSGELPYEVPNSEHKGIVSIQTLLNSGLLLPHEAKYIYESVGPKNNIPDTSISGTRKSGEHQLHNDVEHGSYTDIVITDSLINPFKKMSVLKTNIVNPIKNIVQLYRDSFNILK